MSEWENLLLLLLFCLVRLLVEVFFEMFWGLGLVGWVNLCSEELLFNNCLFIEFLALDLLLLFYGFL